MRQSYHLTIISVNEIHWKPKGIHLPGHDAPNLYVAIDIDGKRVHQTNPSRKQVAMWNQICSLSVDSPSSVVALQIIRKSTWSTHCLAKKEMEISQLLETDEGKKEKELSVVLDYVEKGAMGRPGPTLVVHMISIGHVQAARVALDNAAQDLGNLKSPSTRTVAKIVDIGTEGSDLLSGLSTVLSRLKIVIAIGAEVSKIHPYSNVAWTVLFSVYQAVEKQKETDKSVGRLVQTMADVFSFAEEVKSAVSEKIKRFEKTVYALVKQTEECALFIREYSGHGFSGRMINTEDNAKIQGFITAFEKLRESIDRGTAVETLFLSTKVLEVAEQTAQTQKLSSLKPADMNGTLRPVCLPGTRQEIRVG